MIRIYCICQSSPFANKHENFISVCNNQDRGSRFMWLLALSDICLTSELYLNFSGQSYYTLHKLCCLLVTFHLIFLRSQGFFFFLLLNPRTKYFLYLDHKKSKQVHGFTVV